MRVHRTIPALPDDHGPRRVSHHRVAAQMRETDDWVHVRDYLTRRLAQRAASEIRNSHLPAYRGHVYDARAITTADGAHQVWGRWIGPRDARRASA